MTLLIIRPNFRPESWAQNAGNGISGVQISKNFRGGMPPDPPTIASISAMIPSDLRLDPPLLCNILTVIIGILIHIYQLFRIPRPPPPPPPPPWLTPSLIVGASMGSIAMGRSLIVGASMGSTTMDRSIVFASMGRSIVFAFLPQWADL